MNITKSITCIQSSDKFIFITIFLGQSHIQASRDSTSTNNMCINVLSIAHLNVCIQRTHYVNIVFNIAHFIYENKTITVS